jgi:hypothetical protein
MDFPWFVVILFPKKWKEAFFHRQWSKKPNSEIMVAFDDANDWIDIGTGRFALPTARVIAGECQEKLDRYILPQMRKRGLGEMA